MNNITTDSFPPILSVRDLKCALNLTSYSLSVLDGDESFPFIMIGNQRFILRDSLLEWMKAHEQPYLRKEGAKS